MKITAEFNSIREVQEFINTFGDKAIVSEVSIDATKVSKAIEAIAKDKKSNLTEEVVKVVDKEEVNKVQESNETTEDKKDEEVKVTKEQLRAVFSKLVKAGKQKEAKELTAKYGASKVGEVKEEDYAAIIKEAEELL